jgi:hypothetical protein
MPSLRSNISQVDLRSKPRRRMHYPALIDLGIGQPHRECMIWDISEIGACLTLNEAGSTPDEFQLLLSRGGEVLRRCRVIWRSDLQIGVRFLQSQTAVAPPKAVLEC